MTLRYGVVGAGVVAPLHLEAIAALEDVELVGVASLEPDTLANDELLALEPDVVVICTPHPSHPSLALEALGRGAHVLVEKPLAPEAREGDAMIEGAERAGRLLGVCFQQRFRPSIRAAKKLVDEGALGELVRASVVEGWYRPHAYFASAGWRGTWVGEGGGVLMNQAPHTIDLLCHLAGPPAAVQGRTSRRSQPIETEDTATALLEYANGATATLAVSTIEPTPQRIELVGDRGRLEVVGESVVFEMFDPPLTEHRATSTEMFSQPAFVRQTVELPEGVGDHAAVHRDFAAAVREGREPYVPAREALWSLEIANAITLSSHGGRAETLPVDRERYAALLAGLRA